MISFPDADPSPPSINGSTVTTRLQPPAQQLPQGLLGALLDNLSVPVIVAGGSPRRVVYTNPRALAIIGIDRYQLLGSDIDHLRRLLGARPRPTPNGEQWKGTVTHRSEQRPVTLHVSHGHNLSVIELQVHAVDDAHR